MNILGVDTSTDVCSICIADEKKILADINISYKKSHSVMLMPMIDNALSMINMDIKDIDYFAISKGPGSFTGLRIGASSIKAMAHTLNKKILPISTLEALAYNIYNTDKYIVPIIDARSERVYAGIYKNGAGIPNCYMKDCQTTIKDIIKYIKEEGLEPIFVGDGATNYKSIILDNFDKNCIASMHFNTPRASSIVALSFLYEKEKKYVSYNELLIDYLRLAQAERELIERQNNKYKEDNRI